ncbi:arabinosyltransferase domain-containing protein [Corynebacterium uterequi]|uniref:Cell wall arabinan synthesis protein n=1 Tax=Corynebacterium uterequi TaxID=1072256 RepID=A0A0G3H9Z3_9CORY|nr:arabinosyltransferase domain-containing protein [Corynebacterium uterequi]AKK10114.1 cell wall arabinan synthesis protein [Corynebacterium uterequi]
MDSRVAPRPPADTSASPARTLGIVTGLLAFVLFLAIPLLPVVHTQSSVSWPQDSSVRSVNAPLVAGAPQALRARIPLGAVGALREDETLIVGSIPPSGPQAASRGLFVQVTAGGGLNVSTQGRVVAELSPREVRDLKPDDVLDLDITHTSVTVSVAGRTTTVEEDLRPQVTGVYSELEDDAASELVDAGLAVEVDVDSRFTSRPTAVKTITMWVASLLALVSLWSLWRQDRIDVPRRVAVPSRWRQVTALDAVIVGLLLFWHVFGANTSDDGFILTMARNASDAGYMANYYRWYGAPEAPFGSPYYILLGALADVATYSLWMRLPTLLAGIGTWLILSRSVLPYLGSRMASRRLAHWTAGFVFLVFWFPYNNGLRPEPVIALGTLVTWMCFERCILTRRLLPAALGVVAAAVTLTCGPTGLMAVGAFLVSLPSLVAVLHERLAASTSPRWFVTLGIMSPFLAAGLAVFVPVFADQTLSTVLESTRVRSAVGPSLDWTMEWLRYSTLFYAGSEGSLARRAAMFLLLCCVVLVCYSLARHGKVPGVAAGPTIRLMVIFALSVFFLMFTPTKWTHHFGIYAGIAPVIGALAGVVLSQLALRSAHARTYAVAGTTLLLATSFTGWNSWWYISNFGIPWWDKKPQLKGYEFADGILAVGLVILAVAVIQHLRYHSRRSQDPSYSTAAASNRVNGLLSAQVFVAALLLSGFSAASFAKAFVDQLPAYSVGLGNVRALTGNTAYLAQDVMVETDSDSSFLTPVGGVELAQSLTGADSQGFTPNGIPADLSSEDATEAMKMEAKMAALTDSDGGSHPSAHPSAHPAQDTARKAATVGVNGSYARLPFNLDPGIVPVVGSYRAEAATAAAATSHWYRLPETRSEQAPLIVVSVAGRIHHHDANGVEQPGQTFLLEYGRSTPGGVELLGEREMLDIGPAPAWRNLRLPLDALPAEADAVRLRAVDTSTDKDQWLAFTPPRVPTLAPLEEVIGSDAPGLLDWVTALQFPHQRSFRHYAGVAEIPEYRITPDHVNEPELTTFMDFAGGGALITPDAVNRMYQVPSYLNHDWHQDWGALHRYELRVDSTGQAPALAHVDYRDEVRGGLWQDSTMLVWEEEED